MTLNDHRGALLAAANAFAEACTGAALQQALAIEVKPGESFEDEGKTWERVA